MRRGAGERGSSGRRVVAPDAPQPCLDEEKDVTIPRRVASSSPSSLDRVLKAMSSASAEPQIRQVKSLLTTLASLVPATWSLM